MNPAHKKRWKETAARLSRRLHFPAGYLGLRHPFCGSVQTVILYYHRVIPATGLHEVCSLPQIVVPLDDFEAQLDFLADQYNILSLDEFEKALYKRRAMPLKTVVITFDDGWEDNYTHAFPALKRRGIPATIFLSTDYIGTGRAFWQEQFLHLIQVWRRRVQSGEIPETDVRELPPALTPALLSPDANREALRLIESLKSADEALRDSWLKSLSGALSHPSYPFSTNGFMNWNQVREMHSAGIEFGSHAKTHRLLTGLSRSEIAREVGESREQMEAALNARVTAFSYPNGNYDAGTMAEVKAAGYRLAATTRKGLNTARTNPFELRRMNVNGGLFADSNGRFSADLFEFKLTGLR